MTVNAVKCDTKEEGRAWGSELRLPTRRRSRRITPGNQSSIKHDTQSPRGPQEDAKEREAALALINIEHEAGKIQLEAFGQERAAKLQPTQPCTLSARIRALSSLDLGGVHKVLAQAGGRVVHADKDELPASRSRGLAAQLLHLWL